MMQHTIQNPNTQLKIARTVLLLLSLVTAEYAIGQLPTATILGVVKDASGAVVPGVSLTARNVETGQSRNTVSASDGSYRFPALAVGTYEVRAEQSGFQSEVRSGLTLTVSQEAVVNITLQVGAVAQTVAVTAEAPMVNTTSGSLGGLVNEQRVADLPLNGRNYLGLVLLQPGITTYTNYTPGAGMAGNWYSSNGAPPRSNNYLIDGAMMQNVAGASSASVSSSTMGVEGIREFRVVTNSFSAEYGMVMGSVMEIVTKSGTNTFHGTLLEYLRNSALDARNFFDYPSAATSPTFRLPAFRRNNFGASFGGPIKKDKTFFFTVYEGLRERLGITTLFNDIGAGCHGGAGATITSAACPQLGSTGSVTVAPVVAPLLALFPTPNLSNNEYTFPYTQPTREDYGQERVDHTFSNTDTMFGRWTVDDTEQVQTGGDMTALSVTDLASRNQYATISESHTFSAVLLNTARFSYSRAINRAEQPPTPSLLGPQYSLIPGQALGSISITGISGIGIAGNSPLLHKQNIFAWSDDVFYTRGRHSLKFGTLINHYQQYLQVSTFSRGSVSFANLANFLEGETSSYSGITPALSSFALITTTR